MLVPPAAGLIGVVLSRDELGGSSGRDIVLGIAMQLALGIPAVLLLASGAVPF
jgi:uncharacterized protein (UPF0261 family)